MHNFDQQTPSRFSLLALPGHIFSEFTPVEIENVIDCLGAKQLVFKTGETIQQAGENACYVGALLSGTATSAVLNADGTRHIVDVIRAGDVFGEEILATQNQKTSRHTVATSEAQVLLLGMHKILHPEGPLCNLRSQVVENLFRVMSEKNRQLAEHLEVVTQKSLRSRLSLFLSNEASAQGSAMFTLPLTREQLAEHLNADRSALSRELSRMKTEGLIDYYRSSFKILTNLD